MVGKTPLYVLGMAGLGDSIYERCFVRDLAMRFDVYLAAAWPQLFADIPGLRFVRHPLKLRTQEKNARALPPETWSELPQGIRRLILGYNLREPEDNIITGMERQAPLTGPFVFDLPDMGPSPVQSSRPIAVIRPVSVRGEWANQARNCDPRYVAEAATILRARGFYVVSVADLQAGIENAVGPLPPADLQYHKGELDVRQLLALVRDAAVVVGPIGWILPAAIALGTPAILIGGGHGSINRPARLIDPRMDASGIRWLMPNPFCMCANMLHRCYKGIPGFPAQFERALDEVTSDRLQAVA